MMKGSSFLIILNSITAVMGLAFTSACIYGVVKFEEFEGVFGIGSLWMGIFAGVIAIIVSSLGCWGSIKQKPNYICVYIFALVVLIGLCFGSVLAWQATINDMQLATTNKVGLALKDEAMEDMSDGLLSTYAWCCTGCPDCDDEIAPKNGCEVEGACADVPFCTDGVVSKDTFCYIGADDNGGRPVTLISESICTALTKAHVVDTEFPIVGNVTNGESCGGGDPEKFVRSIYTWLDSKTLVIKIVGSTFIAIIGVTFFVSLAVMWSASRSSSD